MRDPGPALARLAASLPQGRVSMAEADLLAVAQDAWPRHLMSLAQGEAAALPAAVVWPETTQEVQQALVAARELGLRLVPVGGGSSVVGGATPEPGQVVLDLKRMQRVLEIDGPGRTATAEAGILGEQFSQALARRGFTQGHFPSSMYCSTLGGWIAARSAGQFSTRYGKIEDQVLGGVAVLGDGTLVTQGPAPVRTPELDALIGAEGALAVWTQATVRIHPLPAAQAWRGFDMKMERAVATLEEVMASGLVPSVVRLYDPLDSLLHRRPPHAGGKGTTARMAARWPRTARLLSGLAPNRCRLIVGVEGDGERVQREMQHIVAAMEKHGGKDLGEGPGVAWSRRRYAISYEQSRAFRAGLAVDTMEVACAWERVMPVYSTVRRRARAAGALVAAHISHIYVEGAAIYFTFALPLAWGTAAYDRVWQAALSAALSSGANVSHHHGTGRLKAGALAQSLGGATRTLGELVQRFDPGAVLAGLPFRGDRPRLFGGPPTTVITVTHLNGYHSAALVAAAAPQHVAELEHDLAPLGRTLGPAAQLFGAWPLAEATRDRLLWRYNPQLGIIESMAAGVDALVNGVPHSFVPAPRAAAGPEMLSELLRADVTRIWLRTSPRPARSLAWQGDLDWALRVAQVLVRDAALLGIAVTLTSDREHTQVCASIAAGPLAELSEARLRFLAGRDPDGAFHLPALAEPGVRVAGPHASVWRLAWEARACGLSLVLPVIDPFGAAGFVYDPSGTLDADRRQRLTLLAQEVGAWPSLSRESAPPATATGAECVQSLAVHAAPLSLSLAPHAGALDHCTYCPKLCRVSCPVAVAAGSETLTPRQLMRSANLARMGSRPLAADVAARLWACVDCRGCQSLCEHKNDVAHVLQAARAELFEQGYAPASVRAALGGVTVQGGAPTPFRWAFGRTEAACQSSAKSNTYGRASASPLSLTLRTGGAGSFASTPSYESHHDQPPEQLLGGLKVGDSTALPSGATCLFLGCQNRAEDPEPAAAALALARHVHGEVSTLQGSQHCCGHPLWRWGDRAGFVRHAAGMAARLAGVSRLVVDDPGCAYAMRELYPQAGIAMPPVVTVTSLVREQGFRLPDAASYAVHEACFAVRWLGEPALAPALGSERTSVWGSAAGCCGGMLLPHYDAALATQVAESRVADLLGSGAGRIVAASPTCRGRLRAVCDAVDDLATLWWKYCNRKPRAVSS